MTNKEKFIEIMNQNFNTGLTISNWVQQRDVCTPCGYYKKGACHEYTCDDCQKWWEEEYKEVTQNDD